MLFEPLTLDGRKRSAAYHATRLSTLRGRLAKKLDQVDHAADRVEQAAAVLVEATRQPDTDVTIAPSVVLMHLEASQTLGL
ncbi:MULTISPECIES: hypothetical protein [Mesorhizobium]|jgi:hypothetical protein|uniref:Uncharacterized protein n=1 Tax=Rhizobium loti TaxID=381 RepID=A0A8E3B2N0_RHILI|nr:MULTISPECIES: hypothetical protein [Mesorhizobium]AZO43026.1 hypothetical protein EJ076_18990 [Mesorhizobium sp. M7D.F.Ca.US.005.01.1.1]PWJ87376.1 hypothetical protein C8D77_11791 [Mesorhizobium loti]RUX91114.1 hypothetical protein EN993_28230 [Mesorhizobium sp. M7D.F.Ca.US.004.01.2.1]RVA21205.1 hypothetical protein EN935_32290 [Mesorhizobium sp. M7D.F.Ca.US.004.03.1.1]